MSQHIIDSITTILFSKGIITKRDSQEWKLLDDKVVFDTVLAELKEVGIQGATTTDRLFSVIDKLNYPMYSHKHFPDYISQLRGILLEGVRLTGKLGKDQQDSEDTWRGEAKTIK
jgi:hypothetical protein